MWAAASFPQVLAVAVGSYVLASCTFSWAALRAWPLPA